MITLQKGHSSDEYLKRAFTWQTRIGIAPKFGSLPIAHYQADQIHALQYLEQNIGNFPVRCKRGIIQFKAIGVWEDFASVKEMPNKIEESKQKRDQTIGQLISSLV